MDKKLIRELMEKRNNDLSNHHQIGMIEFEGKIEKICLDLNNSKYCFVGLHKFYYGKDKNSREIHYFEPFSTEDIFSDYLKYKLEKQLKITFPNRSEIIHALFDDLTSVIKMRDFTIVKFDFKDYFNSIPTELIFDKYICKLNISRELKDNIKKFFDEVDYTYAGISSSNILVEIISEDFDRKLKIAMKDHGMIFYKRYVDDGLLIFNTFQDEKEIFECIQNVIDSVFNSTKSKVALNKDKSIHIAKRQLKENKSFNYLGYEFDLFMENEKLALKYGITEEKMNKYKKKVDNIFDAYLLDKNFPLLRHRIRAFASRTVYLIDDKNACHWRVRGIISNYDELRFRIDYLNESTVRFLDKMLIEAANEKNIKYIKFLKDKDAPYNLLHNLKKNKTLLFVENIGISRDKLLKMCEEINLTIPFSENMEYMQILKEYLLEVKVGYKK